MFGIRRYQFEACMKLKVGGGGGRSRTSPAKIGGKEITLVMVKLPITGEVMNITPVPLTVIYLESNLRKISSQF